MDLLEIEQRYPGLIQDMDTCIWQFELTKASMEHDG